MTITEDIILDIYGEIILQIKNKNSDVNNIVENILLNSHFSKNVITFAEMRQIKKEIMVELNKSNSKIHSKTALLSTIITVLYKQIGDECDSIVIQPVICGDDYCFISENYLDFIHDGECDEFVFKEHINIKCERIFINVEYELEHNAECRWNSFTKIYIAFSKLKKCDTNLKNKNDFEDLLRSLDNDNKFMKLCKWIYEHDDNFCDDYLDDDIDYYNVKGSLFELLANKIFSQVTK